MAERIGIQIALEGAEKVLSELKGIDKFANSMDRKRYKLKVDSSINTIRKAMDGYRRDQANFLRTWRQAPKYAETFAKKAEAAWGASKIFTFDKAKWEAAAKQYERQMKKWQKFGSSENYNKVMGNFADKFRAGSNEIRDLMHEFQGIEIQPSLNLSRVYNQWSGFVSRLGSSMITAGNTLQRITSPFDSIMRGAMYGIGYGALNKVTEGLSSATSRYDTLKTFPKIMESLGFESDKADASIQRLNDSVIGLPTGLDEIVDMAKRFSLATSDLEKGTDVAIAANNAFLASASTEQQRYQGMMQLNDVLSGKKLQTREWMSLAASMPAAIQEIGKLLGYEKNSEFLQALYGNKIDNSKFIKALREVGTEGGKIAQMAEISKQTFEGLSSNIKNAFSRGGYKLLEALDDVLIAATGEGTVGNFKKITEGIDGIFESGAKWMRSHPEAIMDFFNYLRTFDWKGLVTGFASGAKTVLGILKNLFEMFSGGDTEKVGKFLVYGNLVGKALTILGGGLKGLAPVFGGAGVLGKLIKSGTIGALIGKVLSPLAKIGSARAAIKGAETIAGVGTAASKIPLSWQGVASQAVTIAAIPAVAISFMEVAKAFKTLSQIGSWEGMGTKVLHCMEAIAVFVGEAAGIGALLTSTPAGWFGAIATGVGGVTMAGIAKVMQMSIKAVNDVANAEIPSTDKISAVVGSIKDMMSELQGIETSLPEGQKNVGDNAKKFEDVFGSISAIVKGMEGIADSKITPKKLEKAKETIRTVKESIEGIKTYIAEMFGDKAYTSEIRGTFMEKNMFNGDALDSAFGNAQNVNNILTQINALIDNLVGFSKKAKAIDKLGDMKELTNKIGTMVSDMGTIATRIKQQSEQLEGIGDAPARFEALSKSVTSIKDIMDTVRTMNETYGAGQELTIFNALGRMVSGLKGAVSNLGDLSANAQTLSTAAQKIKTAITDIKSAVEGIDDKIEKTITVKVTAKLSGDKAALDKVNRLSAQVDQARVTLTRAVNNLSGTYNAHVTINVTGTLNKNIPTLPTSSSILNPPHTGGYIDGRGRVMYRASGGAIPIFKRKGSDTVPAMLTPGEYVQNRRAVSHFGVDFMRHINHLDLEGALRSISGRAGRLAGNTVNITNNTNNAKVVQHIHTHDTNYTFRRANRFVEAL